MRSHVLFLALFGSLVGVACTEDEPGGVCGFTEPRQLFASEEQVGRYGPAPELTWQTHGEPDRLFYVTRSTGFTADACGAALEVVPSDGLRHVSDDLALDCEAGIALRRGADDSFEPVLEGVGCDYVATEEAIVTKTSEGLPLLLVDRRDPSVPITPLGDRPIGNWADYVGRDQAVIVRTPDRVLRGGFSSPFVLRTVDGAVLYVDRDDWSVTEMMQGVAELWPSPDGEAFAFIPMDGDDAGDLFVRGVDGEAVRVAEAEELDPNFMNPWWSRDGLRFAVSVGHPLLGHDQVYSFGTGELQSTPTRGRVVAEIGADAVWVAEQQSSGVREVYWEPETGVYRDLWAHGGLPAGNVRATADAFEIIMPEGEWTGFGEAPGDLLRVPFDGSAPEMLGRGVYPGYTRLEDGRIVSHRPQPGPPGAAPPLSLVLIDPASLEPEVIATSVVFVHHLEQKRSHRVLGDLLTWSVVEPGRTGVWAVELAAL